MTQHLAYYDSRIYQASLYHDIFVCVAKKFFLKE